jgi:hypothetical protein
MWFEILYVVVALLLTALIFREACDERFVPRFFGAAVIGLGRPALAIMIALYMVVDAAAFIAKAFRK